MEGKPLRTREEDLQIRNSGQQEQGVWRATLFVCVLCTAFRLLISPTKPGQCEWHIARDPPSRECQADSSNECGGPLSFFHYDVTAPRSVCSCVLRRSTARS